MRALHLVKTSAGATWALRLVRELVRLGVDAHVALPPGPLFTEYVAAGATVHAWQPDLPIREPWRIPGHLEALRRLVATVRPDVIHSHFVGTTLTMRLALGRRSAIPRFFQVPGPLHLEHAIFRLVERLSAGAPDRWIGSCRWTCERYRAMGVAADRVTLSYYGADPAEFDPRSPGLLRRELGLRPGSRIVGMVGYFYAPKRYLAQRRGLKGHEDLVDALAILRGRRDDVVGVFVGGAWGGADHYERHVRRYAARRLGDAAVFLGTRDDIPRLYADFDVVVHPSHSENVGGALESLMLGVPTIATAVGGLPDAVRHGETGWLVPPRSPGALAAAIQEVLADPAHARAIAQAGRRHACQLFALATNAETVLEAYKRALPPSHEAARARIEGA